MVVALAALCHVIEALCHTVTGQQVATCSDGSLTSSHHTGSYDHFLESILNGKSVGNSSNAVRSFIGAIKQDKGKTSKTIRLISSGIGYMCSFHYRSGYLRDGRTKV